MIVAPSCLSLPRSADPPPAGHWHPPARGV